MALDLVLDKVVVPARPPERSSYSTIRRRKFNCVKSSSLTRLVTPPLEEQEEGGRGRWLTREKNVDGKYRQ